MSAESTCGEHTFQRRPLEDSQGRSLDGQEDNLRNQRQLYFDELLLTRLKEFSTPQSEAGAQPTPNDLPFLALYSSESSGGAVTQVNTINATRQRHRGQHESAADLDNHTKVAALPSQQSQRKERFVLVFNKLYGVLLYIQAWLGPLVSITYPLLRDLCTIFLEEARYMLYCTLGLLGLLVSIPYRLFRYLCTTILASARYMLYCAVVVFKASVVILKAILVIFAVFVGIRLLPLVIEFTLIMVDVLIVYVCYRMYPDDRSARVQYEKLFEALTHDPHAY